MGLFGGSKSATTNVTETLTSNNVDNRVIEDGAVVGGNLSVNAGDRIEGLTIEQTDFGAVEGALALGESALESVAGVAGRVTEFGSDVLQRQSVAADNNLAAIKSFATDITSGGQATTSKLIQNIVILSAAVGGIALIVSRVRK